MRMASRALTILLKNNSQQHPLQPETASSGEEGHATMLRCRGRQESTDTFICTLTSCHMVVSSSPSTRRRAAAATTLEWPRGNPTWTCAHLCFYVFASTDHLPRTSLLLFPGCPPRPMHGHTSDLQGPMRTCTPPELRATLDFPLLLLPRKAP